MNNSRIRRNTPDERELRFQARWASGRYHHRSWFAANRCLDVRLTSVALHTRLMFPYSLFSSTHWGFKNAIPIKQVQTVQAARFLNWWPTVEITFLDDAGRSRCLEIGFTGPLPQLGTSQQEKRDIFLRAMQKAQQEGQ